MKDTLGNNPLCPSHLVGAKTEPRAWGIFCLYDPDRNTAHSPGGFTIFFRPPARNRVRHRWPRTKPRTRQRLRLINKRDHIVKERQPV